MLKKVLIANRGEIAIRISHAAAALNMQSVSVFAPPDAQSLHTRHTDETVALVGEDPVQAYLDIPQLVQIAQDTECDCVHPGYGFLSENANFAEACAQAGLQFVGPAPQTLALFGDKVAARELAESLDIPVIPGRAVASVQDVLDFVSEHALPVMLKAAAGGGGRGMRAIHAQTDIEDAFARCRSEALASFVNDAVFVEKLIEQPRHIEVQIIADHQGQVVHLHERDCSIQQRHQKVVEIAPAPGLDAALKADMFSYALRLAQASEYRNAGTVEFLVTQNDCYFIECNPRIQVEHTITEQVMGVDLVKSQLQIAAGADLADCGLLELSAPQGYAIQCRVVAQGPGTLTGYKEPAGMGIRVDGYAYTGFTPPTQYDPLLAKLICSTAHGGFADALALSQRALSAFHIQGVPSNIGLLTQILNSAEVQQGTANTSLVDHLQDNPATNSSPSLALLEQMTRGLAAPAPASTVTVGAAGLAITEEETGVTCPMAGNVLELSVEVGNAVSAGDPICIISAMKMETTVTAPCSGTVHRLDDLDVGTAVATGQVLATLLANEDGIDISNSAQSHWQPTLQEVATLQDLANQRLAPGSTDPGVVRQRSRGKLTCRERIDLLIDAGTFREVGSIAGFASYDEAGEIDAFTPANHVGGWGEVDARTTIVCADDFTSRGGHADGAIGAKSLYLDRLSMELRIPSVRLLDGSSGGGSVAAMVPQQKKSGESEAKESSGAIKAGRPRVAGTGGSFLPGHLGSNTYTRQLNTVPVVNMLLGSVVGIGAAKAVLGHFSVMVRDISQLFVAGPPVVSHAMGYDITKEDLGGWHIHCTNGSVDNLAESEQDAFEQTKRFLSYMPGSVYETPPVIACDDPADRAEQELLTIIPRKRTSTFDMRRAIALMADQGSFFEVGPLWGTDQITGFVRFNGHPMGVIASDSRHANGGALTADGCDKLIRHLDLCDTFNLPLLNLIDNPGFAVGLEHEIRSTIRKGGEWMVAFAQIQVPIFSVLMRRSFGVAGNNYATPQSSPSVRVTWPAADVGGIPPEGGIEAAYKRQLAEAQDPAALRAELEQRIESARGPVGPLNKFQVEEMIDPRHTRRLICEWIPTAYKILQHGDRLGPRDLQFRP